MEFDRRAALGDHVVWNEIFKSVYLWFTLNLAGVEVSSAEVELLGHEVVA